MRQWGKTMRSRLPLYLNSLSLDEILFIESELSLYKERFRGHYTVLAMDIATGFLGVKEATDNTQRRNLSKLHEMYQLRSAMEGGALLDARPECPVFLLGDVGRAAKVVHHLIEGLRDSCCSSKKLTWRFGMATGEDILAEDSWRATRTSVLVKRALRLAAQAEIGRILLDEVSWKAWPEPQSGRQILLGEECCWEAMLVEDAVESRRAIAESYVQENK